MDECKQPEDHLNCGGHKSAVVGSRLSVVEWPLPTMRKTDDLGLEQAQDLIGHGAATFHGYFEYTARDHYQLYGIVGNGLSGDTDQQRPAEQVTKYMSATLTGMPNSLHPWRSLEQPSLLSCFGEAPGSITLNYWVGTFNDNPQVVEQNGKFLKLREVGLLWLLQRIQHLEFGLETDVRTNSPHDFRSSCRCF